MKREEIYKVIDSEREYQESKWTNASHKTHEIEAWIIYMEYYLNRAKEEITLFTIDEGKSLDQLRKVVALGVACFEIHGIKERI